MQADSAIWFAAPRPPTLAVLLPILWVKFSACGGVFCLSSIFYKNSYSFIRIQVKLKLLSAAILPLIGFPRYAILSFEGLRYGLRATLWLKMVKLAKPPLAGGFRKYLIKGEKHVQ